MKFNSDLVIKYAWWALICLALYIALTTCYTKGYKDATKEFITNNISTQQVDSVTKTIVEIKTKIDTVVVYRTKMIKIYDKKVAEVNNLSDSAAVNFFTSYLANRFIGNDTGMVYPSSE